MITSAGVGSGLEVESIIRQLMAAERQPVNRLEAKRSGYEAQVSAYGKLKSALSDFRSSLSDLDRVTDFALYSASSEDENIFTASAGSDAAKGSYEIKVQNLAEAHKIRTSSGFADGASFNSGTVTVELGSDSFAVTVDSTNNSLSGIRDAINSASDNPGVTASIINDGTNDYLTLTSDETGASNTIKVTTSEDGTITGQNALSNFDYDHAGTASSADDTGSMTQLQAFEDASLEIDGLAVSSSTNAVTGAITGVTINLKAEDTANTYTLTVDRDVEAVKELAQAFVDAYNDIRQSTDDLHSGALQGDNTVLSIQRQILDVLNTTPSGISSQYSYLTEIGITLQEDGSMSLDESEFESALSSDFDGVAELFGNDNQGYAFRLRSLTDDLLQTDGILDARQDGLDSRIDSVDSRIEQLERRLELTEQRYRDQFTALDQLVGQLNQTSSFLTQQLSNLPFAGSG